MFNKNKKRQNRQKKKVAQGIKRNKKEAKYKKLIRKQTEKNLKKVADLFLRLENYLKTEDIKDIKTIFMEEELESLANKLGDIPDFRKPRGVRHELKKVLVMILLGLLAGKCSYNRIANFLSIHEGELTILLGLRHGVPSKDTIRRIMSSLDADILLEKFHEWIQSYYKLGKRYQIIIDGKALRALTAKVKGEKNAPYILNILLYDRKSQTALSIYSAKVDLKTNEMPVIKQVLDCFDYCNVIVTIDAAGTNIPVIKKIIKNGAIAVLPVKKNQKKLFKACQTTFTIQEREYKEKKEAQEKFEKEYGVRMEMVTSLEMKIDPVEKGHGRIEQRTYMLTDDLSQVKTIKEGKKPKWLMLNAIGKVERSREVIQRDKNNHYIETTPALETVYYLLTEKISADLFGQIVRNHWAIENRLHYKLDGLSFMEDRARMHTGNAAFNMSLFRKMALNIISLDVLRNGKKKTTPMITDDYAADLEGTLLKIIKK